MTRREDLLLYAVTDRSWLNGRSLYSQVEEALMGGVTFVQLREKTLDEESFFNEAIQIQALCNRYHVPFVINDNVELAKRINADGVHVGQEDMPATEVKKILGANKIIGVSVQTVEQAVQAEKRGADYLGVGAVFKTGSKGDAKDVSLTTLADICKAVRIPVIAIGGISPKNLGQLKGSGICGIAVIQAIFAQENIKEATKNLWNQVKTVVV